MFWFKQFLVKQGVSMWPLSASASPSSMVSHGLSAAGVVVWLCTNSYSSAHLVMSLAGYGLNQCESKHGCQIIAWTWPRGPVLYNNCQWHHHPPEGGPAETESHSALNLSLSLKSRIGTDTSSRPEPSRTLSICHCFSPDRTWHKVNDMKVIYSGG